MKKILLILLTFLTLSGFGQDTQVIDSIFAKSKRYKDRFVRDGGVMDSDRLTKAYYQMAEEQGIAESIEFGFIGTAALKKRESTIYQYATKLYDMFGTNNATQTTESLQPFISGNIAPNELPALKKPNGGVRYMTHPSIVFNDGQEWSLTWYGTLTGTEQGITQYMSGDITKLGTIIYIDAGGSTDYFAFRSNSGNVVNFGTLNGITHRQFIGKFGLVTLTADESKTVKLYFNGILISSTTATTTDAVFNSMFRCRDAATIQYGFPGVISSYIIRSQALPPEQVAAEHALLSDMFPEIPSVQIGSQEWATSNLEMVATPLGNVIPNVTLAENTERVVNGGFDVDANWTKNTGWTISGGKAVATNTPNLIIQAALTNVTWYKVTYTVEVTSGTVVVAVGSGVIGPTISTSGAYTHYLKRGTSANFAFAGNSASPFTGTIDNASAQEIGWNDLDGLYTYLTTTGGMTAANALKECAAWAYYNNDNTIGSVYGKIYNGYGKDLLRTDIATKSDWGWHIATEAELTQFATNDGYRIKAGGTNYWDTANGTNTTGLTMLGGGIRNAITGAFEGLKDSTAFWCGDVDKVLILFDDGTAEIQTVDKTFGAYIRLTKD